MDKAQLIVDLPSLEKIKPQWDALAALNRMPLAAPAWMLAWWRHQAPSGAQLRVFSVSEGEELIGIAPFFVDPGPRGKVATYRLLGADFCAPVAPLALPGREWDVAEILARALVEAKPRPDVLALEPMLLGSPWALALRHRWPGSMRPLTFTYNVQAAPIISLHDESFEAWLASRSSKFRTSMRRLTRLFEAEGGTMRMSTTQTLQADVRSFARLHAMRWEGRGHSRLGALGERLEHTLCDAGYELLEDEWSAASGTWARFRLRMLEIGTEAICADLSLAAGGEVVGFNTGWDEHYSHLSPTLLAFLHKIEEGFRHGDKRVALGWGEHGYKLRFANGNAPIAWSLLLAPGARLPLALASTAPLIGGSWMRSSGRRLLTDAQIERLRPLARKLPR